ncbi:hypothetical protein [Halomontanus rarus]|uniref:hypothetical protein n=1 Tax=Halomontanus rarus TaxID=3034020 RepID=UPI00307C6E6A
MSVRVAVTVDDHQSAALFEIVRDHPPSRRPPSSTVGGRREAGTDDSRGVLRVI